MYCDITPPPSYPLPLSVPLPSIPLLAIDLLSVPLSSIPSHQPPAEAIKRLAALVPPVNETVVVYLMSVILDGIGTDVSMEFSMV